MGHGGPSGLTLIALQSGSNGNCIYVEGGGVSVLFDAGIGGREARRRLGLYGREIGSAAALVLSHDHSDHARSAGVFHRMFGLPLRMTGLTEEFVGYRLGRVGGVALFRPGDVLQFGGLRIETVPTPHDGAEGVAFVVSDGARRLGILTDLGHVFEGLGPLVSTLDAVFIESNYDPEMLEYGPYPYYLQEGIRGPGGHLSNAESAALLREWGGARLQWVCLAHLSEQNNRPELALQTHRAALGTRLPIHVAGRYGPAGPFEL
jgi:phosphoribosyl 1,2-cyclic phosphodiesterase